MEGAALADAYAGFLARKAVIPPRRGLDQIPELHPSMFPHQRATTEFLLGIGSGAAFLDTGLGKSFVELEWSRAVAETQGRPVMIQTPLAVGPAMEREARRFGIDAAYVRDPEKIRTPVIITNYEMAERFDIGGFAGIALDESSILKTFTGATSRRLIGMAEAVDFRLAGTATPAPNDHTELGQHSAFLGIMPSPEMLTRWFIADQSNMGNYRLKGHAVRLFWSWVASWARCVTKPSDLGFPDDGYILPPLTLHRHVVRSPFEISPFGTLFPMPEMSATSVHNEKRRTLGARVEMIAELVSGDHGEPWIVWCDLDDEAEALCARIGGAVEVRGSMTVDEKEKRLLGFEDGSIRVLVTKPRIAGFGLNWQHCARVAFAGLSFSYEAFYQAVRRCWRFGQLRPVDVHVAMADTEMSIWEAVSRKADDHEVMKAEMVAAMRRAAKAAALKVDYQPQTPMALPAWLEAA